MTWRGFLTLLMAVTIVSSALALPNDGFEFIRKFHPTERVEKEQSQPLMVKNANVKLQIDLGRHLPQTAHLRSGSLSVVVPEPNTLSLLGTGALGIAGLLRRKFKA